MTCEDLREGRHGRDSGHPLDDGEGGWEYEGSEHWGTELLDLPEDWHTDGEGSEVGTAKLEENNTTNAEHPKANAEETKDTEAEIDGKSYNDAGAEAEDKSGCGDFDGSMETE